MIACPVCEHVQPEGGECQVCGKVLAVAAAGDGLDAQLEGLDPTGHAPVDTTAPLLPELEPTHHPRAAHDAGHAPPPDLVTARAAPVDVEVPPLPGVEQTSAGIPDDVRTPLPAIAACRYCRTPAPPGERICSRCGMRLPVLAAEREAEGGEQAWRCSCGTLARGILCPTCGARRAGGS